MGGKISKDEFYNYLATQKIDNKDYTYAEYLFGTNDINGLKQEISKNQSAPITFGTIEVGTGKYYYVTTGITSEVIGRGWKIAAASVVGVVASFTPIGLIGGTIIGAVLIGAGEVGAMTNPEILAIPVKGNGIDNTFMAPTIVEANSDSFRVLDCESVNTLA